MLVLDHFHTGYCTNIHPGEDWETTFSALRAHVPGIRDRVSPDRAFGIGLRLSDQASRELGEGDRLHSFRDWLREEGCYVFTMNGFPFGAFHGTRVKDQVHHPDWTTKQRLEYTLRLFRQLQVLLPEGMEGGISTSPISYRHWHPTAKDQADALRKGARQMAEVAIELWRIQERSGVDMHLDIEPEPDGLLENTEEVIRFYREYLLPEGIPILKKSLGLDETACREALLRHIAVCYDICHFALAYESPEQVFPEFEAEDIRIGKIQVSAALKIRPQPGERDAALQALREFDEPVYLHQVTRRSGERVLTYPDLPELLKEPGDFKELRAHFHVPIFTDQYGLLEATQPEILDVIEALKKNPVSRHLEVETYTWEVLPKGLKEDLETSIAREMQWLKDALER